MSKGPGKWQRLVLEVVAGTPVGYFETVDTMLRDWAGIPRPTRAEHEAVRRAVQRLALVGKVAVARCRPWAESGRPEHHLIVLGQADPAVFNGLPGGYLPLPKSVPFAVPIDPNPAGSRHS
jgi:hypothetical protein